MKSSVKKFILAVALSFFFFAICLVSAPFIGSSDISFSDVFQWPINFYGSSAASIFWLTRMPRTLLAALAGAALSAAGVTFQALLRNPLATPYTLGVSSGASFGAVLALVLGIDRSILGIPGIQLLGFVTAIGTILLVYRLAEQNGTAPTHILLLAGVTISFFFAALILFLQYVADFTQTYRIVHWLMGSLDIAEYDPILTVTAFVIPSLMIMFGLAKDFNLFSAGDESAHARGVAVEKSRKLAYLSASLATAAVVSITGPIGFVGLIIPHTMRLIVGADHRILMPVSIFSGAGFLIICDTISRTLFIASGGIPIGVLTALIGGPFFLVLLFRLKIKS
ncbi:iron ABC transporter permease [bacterium]|nr:iron ABC transporter permease [candidate division CSSED10-310 bacterium]